VRDSPASDIVRAYDASGRAWARDAAAVTDRLAEAVVGCWPEPLVGRLIVDLGAGTGSASRAVAAAGGVPVALDPAVGMLRHVRVPSVAADAATLPIRSGAADGLVATFSLTHLPDPVAGFREAARVLVGAGTVLASAHVGGRDHPVKAAVDAALAAEGWRPPRWYVDMRSVRDREAAVLLDAARAAGLVQVGRIDLDVDTGLREPDAMVAWRLAMAQAAPFVASLAPARREALVRRALGALGDAPPLVIRVAVIRGHTPA
jgi:SAM-dependent methyltransferase